MEIILYKNNSRDISRYIKLIYRIINFDEDISEDYDLVSFIDKNKFTNNIEENIKFIYNCYLNYLFENNIKNEDIIIDIERGCYLNKNTNEEVDIPWNFMLIKKYENYYKGIENFPILNSDNPYLEIFNNLKDDIEFKERELLVDLYSWAIPNDVVLNKIKEFASKIIEIGAGSGYWSYLLNKKGCDIIATDLESKETWFNVIKEDYKESIEKYQDRILMLCWPVVDIFGLIKNKTYKQKQIIYIGEYDGCTGSLLPDLENENMIRNIEIIDIPKYKGINDKCYLINLI